MSKENRSPIQGQIHLVGFDNYRDRAQDTMLSMLEEFHRSFLWKAGRFSPKSEGFQNIQFHDALLESSAVTLSSLQSHSHFHLYQYAKRGQIEKNL